MNKILIGWNVVLTAGLIYFMISGTSNSSSKENVANNDSTAITKTPDIDVPQQAAKVVYINNDTLFQNFEMYEDLQDELVAEKVKLESKYRRELEKLEKEYLYLKENEWSMTNAQIQKSQADLMQKQQDMVKMEQELTQRFAQKENNLVKRIKKTIEDYLEVRKDQYGYDFVLSKSGIDGIHFANKDREITYEVIEGLNAEYRAKKAVKKDSN